MKVLGIAGPSNRGKTTLVERLVDRLDERGRVGTVKHIDCDPDIDTAGKDTARHRDAGAVRVHGISEGEWFATGSERTLDDVLDDLARTCDYAVVEGYGGSALPKIIVGDPDERTDIAEGRGDVLLTAGSGDDVTVEDAVAAIESTEPYETLGSLVQQVKASPHAERAGAIATFTGRVRSKDSPDDDPTEHLEFERYDEVAAERMAAIKAELEARDGIFEVLLHHRTGVVEAGEDIVFVVVLAGHRREAFETVEDGIDRLKDEVPLFKKEVTVSEEFWAHER